MDKEVLRQRLIEVTGAEAKKEEKARRDAIAAQEAEEALDDFVDRARKIDERVAGIVRVIEEGKVPLVGQNNNLIHYQDVEGNEAGFTSIGVLLRRYVDPEKNPEVGKSTLNFVAYGSDSRDDIAIEGKSTFDFAEKGWRLDRPATPGQVSSLIGDQSFARQIAFDVDLGEIEEIVWRIVNPEAYLPDLC